MAPSGTRFEVEKFNETENFGLWQTRVKDLLAQQGCLKALREAKPAKMDAEDWEELQMQAAGTTRKMAIPNITISGALERWCATAI
jgi:hypothetical protein